MSATDPAAPRCPDCGAELDLSDATEAGDLADCPNCGATFELVSTAPIRLEPFVDEEK